tara:strand:- start:4758 stop:4889 length:132 start_codon:yes stop_codon:yes gene_type:complete
LLTHIQLVLEQGICGFVPSLEQGSCLAYIVTGSFITTHQCEQQ